MNNIKKFLHCAGVRAVKTLAQTAIATIGTTMAWGDVDWKYLVSVSTLACFLSLLTSVATGLPEVDMYDDIESK